MPLEAGVYRITNANPALSIDLSHGKSDDLTPIAGWTTNGGFNQYWAVQPIAEHSDTYTLRNFAGGSYMQLAGSSAADGTPIVGFHSTGEENQQWIIRQPDDLYWKIQCKATGTFLDLYNGGSANGTKITGWTGDWATPTTSGHQSWIFTKIGYI